MSTDSYRELRRGPMRVPLFFKKPGFHWSKMCAQSRQVLFTFRILLFSRLFLLFFASHLFCFLDQAEVLVGSSVVVPFLLFFLSSLRVCHVYSFSSFFLSFNFSSSAFVLNSFFLRICVYFLPLLLISLSFFGGFLVKEVFLLCFHFCTGCQQCVRMCF